MVLGVIDLQDYAKGANFITELVKMAVKAGKAVKTGKGK